MLSSRNLVETLSKLEDIVFHISSENIEEAIRLFSEFRPKLLAKLINDISFETPFSYKLLGDLYSYIKKDTNKYSIITHFTQYLTLKGFLKDKNFYGVKPETNHEISWYEKGGIADKSPEYYILNNDVQNFSFNYGQIDLKNHQIKWVGHRMNSIVSFSAFVGSLDILKYLLVNDYLIEDNATDDDTVANAIKGGSEAVIEFLVSKECSFDNRLANAVIHHQNRIAYWLLDNYRCEYIQLPLFILSWNTELFLYFLDERKDIYEMTTIEMNSMEASESNNNDVMKQFITDYIKQHSTA